VARNVQGAAVRLVQPPIPHGTVRENGRGIVVGGSCLNGDGAREQGDQHRDKLDCSLHDAFHSRLYPADRMNRPTSYDSRTGNSYVGIRLPDRADGF
jgi:hypothetical protein